MLPGSGRAGFGFDLGIGQWTGIGLSPAGDAPRTPSPAYHLPMATPVFPPLDADHAAFIQSGISMALASRSAANLPSVARGWGCRVSPDRREVRVYVAPTQAASLLEDLGADRPLAAVFNEPKSHRTIQLKAGRATIVPPEDEDLAVVARYIPAFTVRLAAVGYGEPWAAAYLQAAAGPLLAVCFTPVAAFGQTPGPRAGEPLQG